MGEVGMSLLFKNVGSSTAGKGDLSINGEEFEIKGEGATLGEKPILLWAFMLIIKTEQFTILLLSINQMGLYFSCKYG